MTIRHMKIFVSVYQAQSITRAAEQLHMTQPGRQPRYSGIGALLRRVPV